MKQIKLLAYRGVRASAADERPLVVLFARADSHGWRAGRNWFQCGEWFQYGKVASTREQIRTFRELARRLNADEIHVQLRDPDVPHEHLVTIQYRPDAPEGEQWTFKKQIPGTQGQYKTCSINDFKLKEA